MLYKNDTLVYKFILFPFRTVTPLFNFNPFQNRNDTSPNIFIPILHKNDTLLYNPTGFYTEKLLQSPEIQAKKACMFVINNFIPVFLLQFPNTCCKNK